MLWIKQIAKKMGIDKAIAYSSGARVIQGFTGVGSMFFISTFLTGVEQGFYFTFGSILALQVFFELGLTGIMTQYVAHVASHLQLDEDSYYQGERRYVSRLASLVHFCVKWYVVIALYEQMMGKKMNVHFGGRAYKKRAVMVPYKHYNVLPNWNAKVMINKGLALLSMGEVKS